MRARREWTGSCVTFKNEKISVEKLQTKEDKRTREGRCGRRRAWTGRWVSLLQSLNEAPAPEPQ